MTPSEFYKQRRPELFSDSEIISQATLPREVLAYELSKISTNQKQDEFETLCRRLAEKFIAPNLIPQVGPTGGGDGKTDSETYPVSENISDRWFTPENGWDKDENWAFAISAKEAWKGKAKGDVKKIVETKRGYTRVYFISNQLISSKKKKDAQDEFIKDFEIDVVILDGEWILEKIYGNDLINLVVDSLNLSSVYKNEVKLGSNDTERIEELEVLESKINNPAMYSEYDFQKVEDALESAILSRMLEKPRDEVEGKFDRALRFCKKNNNTIQLMRIYYQRAWTYINWYDDYEFFIEDFINFKKNISLESNIIDIDYYIILYTSLHSLFKHDSCNLVEYGIDIKKEREEINQLLNEFMNDNRRPTSVLRAKTHNIILELIYRESDVDKLLIALQKVLKQSESHIDYPFETTKNMVEEIFSQIFSDNKEMDNLIDLIADMSSKRTSEIEGGKVFFNRAIKKLQSKFYKESIVYFGKSIKKLAKEETPEHMYFSLMGLGMAYKELGLIWASNNCYISACHLSFKLSDEEGTFSKKTYMVIKEIVINELFIGRIPALLSWYEMLTIFYESLNIDDSAEELPFGQLYDMTLAIRMLYTKNTSTDILKYLPKMLEYQMLPMAHDTILYKQGYIDLVLEGQDAISDEQELDEHFKMLSHQPFFEQMLYDTNFMSEENLSIYSNLLGSKFQVNFFKDIEMLLVAETLLVFFEGFMGTSLSQTHSHREKIIINLIKSEDDKIYFEYDEESYEYNFYINRVSVQSDFELLWEEFVKFSIEILGRDFFIKNIEKHFTNLFKKEELMERLFFTFHHRNNVLNILGEKPKLFFDDWINYYKPNEYAMKREVPISFNYEKIIKETSKRYKKEDIEEIAHNKVSTHTVIDISLWDKAKWKGVGFSFYQGVMGIFLAFRNIDSAKKIFDKWKDKVGNIDSEELISITIVKGINKNHPYWYGVMISKNENILKSSGRDGLYQSLSRIHTMTPSSPENLNNLLNGLKTFKKYILYPVSIDENNNIEHFWDKGIIKTSLIIKDAWEVGINDLERAVIMFDDEPIIPDEHRNDAPVLEVLKGLRKFQNE